MTTKYIRVLSHSCDSIILKPSPYSDNPNRILKVMRKEDIDSQYNSLVSFKNCTTFPERHPIIIKLTDDTIKYLNDINGRDIRLEEGLDDDINDTLSLNSPDVYGLELDYIQGILFEKVPLKQEIMKKFTNLIDDVMDNIDSFENHEIDFTTNNIIVDDENNFKFLSVRTFKKLNRQNTEKYLLSILLSEFLDIFNPMLKSILSKDDYNKLVDMSDWNETYSFIKEKC